MHVDKRITLAAFKQHLEPFVGVLSSHFKVFRVYTSNQEFETVRLNETLSSFSDDNKVDCNNPCKISPFKNGFERAGEMAQWLRVLTELPKVLSSTPSNRVVAHNHP